MGAASVSAKTVIIADDTAFVRDRFRSALENAGHRAVSVKSAAELLARIRADLAQLDLIVLDLRLPHQPGVDLVRSIRKLDDGKLTILVFSGTMKSAIWQPSASPAMSMSTAPCSTFCRRWRRISFRTASIAGAVPGSCWGFPFSTGSAIRSPPP